MLGSLYPLIIGFEHMGLCHETDGVEECCITRAVPRVVHETNDTTFGRFTNGVDIRASGNRPPWHHMGMAILIR